MGNLSWSALAYCYCYCFSIKGYLVEEDDDASCSDRLMKAEREGNEQMDPCDSTH